MGSSRRTSISLLAAVLLLAGPVAGLQAAEKQKVPPPAAEKGVLERRPLIFLDEMKYEEETAPPEVLTGTEQRVLPEVATRIFLSSVDVNRLICAEGPVKDVVFSKEKGLVVKIHGSNAFLKFRIARDPDTGELKFASVPTDIYVVCGDDSVYTLIALPKKIPAQTVHLASRKRKIKEVLSLFEGLPFEQKVLKLLKWTVTDEIPEALDVSMPREKVGVFREINLELRRVVTAPGEGLRVKEFLARAASGKALEVDERTFLVPELSKRPVAIAVERFRLSPTVPVRVFVVEQVEEEP